MAKGRATMDQVNEYTRLTGENTVYGVLIPGKKQSQRDIQVANEKARKKDYIRGRISYGLVGQSGRGDVHFEYDTVVNQMLHQMYLWNLRPMTRPVCTQQELADYIRAGAVPAQYFYTLVESLAEDARSRRAAAGAILAGAAPVVLTPRVIAPPGG